MSLDVDTILSTAEGIYHQIVSAPHLTDQIRVILGLTPLGGGAAPAEEADDGETTTANGTTSMFGQDMEEVMYQIGLDMNF